MANSNIVKQLQDRFGRRSSFTRKELYDLYCETEPELKETTFRWRIYYLKKEGIIRSLSNGVFTLGQLPVYVPSLNHNIRELSQSLSSQFYGLRYCIWSTSVIHEFMLHIPGNSYTILEVEREAMNPVFNHLKDIGIQNVFLQPKEIELERYVAEKDNAIIIKRLITKAPIQIIENIPTTSLEKLIVDLFSDKKIFSAYQGSELAHIINNAYKKYSIDMTRVMHYAGRRVKTKELTNFLLSKTNIPRYIFP